MNIEIGGFLDLNLFNKNSYHPNAYKINLARHGINIILKYHNYQKVYLPKYISDTVYKILDIPYEFYEIDETFMTKLNPNIIRKNEVIIFPNYFGINNKNILKALKRFDHIIIDNAHAFYQKLKGHNVVYSARKFFGVPDGSYIYTKKKLDLNLKIDNSHQKFLPLLKKKELGSNISYNKYLEVEKNYAHSEPKFMSKTTNEILNSINYKNDIKLRIENYKYFHENLKFKNRLNLKSLDGNIPMNYPFLFSKKLKNLLLKYNIYIPTYYSNSKKYFKKNSFENELLENLIALPIDGRVNKKIIKYILEFII